MSSSSMPSWRAAPSKTSRLPSRWSGTSQPQTGLMACEGSTWSTVAGAGTAVSGATGSAKVSSSRDGRVRRGRSMSCGPFSWLVPTGGCRRSATAAPVMVAGGISIVRPNASMIRSRVKLATPPRSSTGGATGAGGVRVPAAFDGHPARVRPGQAEQFLAQPGEPAGQQVVAGAGRGHRGQRRLLAGLQHGQARPALGLRADEARHLRGERPRRGGRQEHPPAGNNRLDALARIRRGAFGDVQVHLGELPPGQVAVDAQGQLPLAEHRDPGLAPERRRQRARLGPCPQRRGPQQVLARRIRGGVPAQRVLGGQPRRHLLDRQRPGVRRVRGGLRAAGSCPRGRVRRAGHRILAAARRCRAARPARRRATSPANWVRSWPLTRQARVPSVANRPS